MAYALNPAQQQAVDLCDQPLLVLAGAGSGKTGVITRKVVHLISRRHVLPEKVAAITFTRKAAREMRSRISRELSASASDIWISTFHALGLRILRGELATLGYRPGFSIFDPQDTQGLLREILPAATGREDLERVRWQISSWKNENLTPENAPGEAQTLTWFEEYEERLKRYNAFDFDDLVSKPAQLLASDAEARLRWQQRFRHILVDEFQDTNHTQYGLLKLLAGDGAGLTAVGDDDQSIYGWRGARPDILDDLGRDFEKLSVVKLEQNYRSSGTVLKAANAVIANNPHTHSKALWSALGEGEPISLRACADPQDEADQVVSALLKRRFQSKANPADFAILYRSNHQSRPLEQALRTHRLPYVISGGPSWFDRSEIKDVLSYLRLIANPADDAAFLRVVNRPRRGIGSGTVDRLAELAGQRGGSLLDACREPPISLAARAQTSVRAFVAMLDRLMALVAEPAELLEALLEETAYFSFLESEAADDVVARARKRSVQELKNFLAELDGSLEDILQQVSLGDDSDDESSEDAVRLMTLHAAKGLEFRHVFMIGVEEGLLPHQVSLDEGQVNEERRLMYVGMTRAKQTLCLSYCQHRRRFGEDLQTGPSRFIDEIPDALIDQIGGEAAKPADARGHLKDLRAMLDLD